MASDRLRQDRKFLFAVALVSTLAIVLTAPADGGSQWGPRLLLFVCIPGAILATDALGAIIQNSRSTGMIAVFALLVSSVFVQRNAYRELRGGKRTYERIVEFVEHEIPAHSYIVTDLWWFDQVTAALYPTRVVLFVNSAAAERRALGGLATCPQARVFIVRSKVESRPDSIERWLEFAPFAVKRKAEIPERALTIADLRVVGSRE